VGQGVNVAGGKPAGDRESGEFDILLMKSGKKKHIYRRGCFGGAAWLGNAFQIAYAWWGYALEHDSRYLVSGLTHGYQKVDLHL
jgi:hypothetical protein